MAGIAEPGKRQRELERRTTPLLDTITALAFAIEAKDPYTRGHCEEVSWWATRIALQVGLSEPEIEDIKLAGIVHDIGKIIVPEDILNKPTLLTAEEFGKMKTHAAWGAKILATLKEKGIARIVRHHHERYDGNGYPDHLEGEEIPLGARIVAVAESFHCMVRGARYKSACTVENALAELRRCSGTQLDPRVVMAFLDWLESHGESPDYNDKGLNSESQPPPQLRPSLAGRMEDASTALRSPPHSVCQGH